MTPKVEDSKRKDPLQVLSAGSASETMEPLDGKGDDDGCPFDQMSRVVFLSSQVITQTFSDWKLVIDTVRSHAMSLVRLVSLLCPISGTLARRLKRFSRSRS